jgi:hypothetical protein
MAARGGLRARSLAKRDSWDRGARSPTLDPVMYTTTRVTKGSYPQALCTLCSAVAVAPGLPGGPPIFRLSGPLVSTSGSAHISAIVVTVRVGRERLATVALAA